MAIETRDGDDACDPADAPQTLLRYAIAPGTADFGATVTFSFTALNDGTDAIVFNPGDLITLTMPVGPAATDLLANATIGTASLSPGFAFAQAQGQPGTFNAGVFSAQTIASGQILSFQVTGAQINATGTTGQQSTPVSLPVSESIGEAQNNTFLVVTKMAPELSVQCSAAPQTVGLGQPTDISWVATGAAYVVLTPGNLRQTCTGNPSKGVFKDVVAPQVPVTSFQVTAYTDDQRSVPSIPVNVQTSAPSIDAFEPQGLAPIGYQDNVTLRWSTRYATSVYLTPNKAPPQVAPTGSLVVVPSSFALPNAASVAFTLTADGYGGPTRKTVTIPFQPVEIVSFGYPQPPPAPSFPVAVVRNGLQQVVQTATDPNVYQLTATGAGGPLYRWIGPGSVLEIEYFGGTPNPVAPGGSCTLSWQTRNAASATLNETAVTLSSSGGSVQTGSTTVSPTGTMSYVLAVVDGSGNSISNTITVTVSA